MTHASLTHGRDFGLVSWPHHDSDESAPLDIRYEYSMTPNAPIPPKGLRRGSEGAPKGLRRGDQVESLKKIVKASRAT